MRILGIETSCDETAAAVVDDGTKIVSNIIASSQELHTKTGGIIPENAAREQVKSIIPVIEEALGENKDSIDAIAVTYGPGLIGSLLVGVETAKTLSLLWQKPIVPVNHLVAHIYANWVTNNRIPELPAMALVVSGGHTDLVLIEEHGKIKWLAGTRDDAAGEAFDKTARLLGLPYPGGPSIAKAAEKFIKENPNHKLDLFPRPLINDKTFDWSFSGLKTAVLRELQNKELTQKEIEHYSAQVQEAIIDVLVDKTLSAARQYRVSTLLLAGGVAANDRLREKFTSEIVSKEDNISLHVPEPKLCTDNAATIASCAFYNFNPISWDKLDAKPSLTIAS